MKFATLATVRHAVSRSLTRPIPTIVASAALMVGIASGQEIGVSANKIRLGHSVPLTGTLAKLGTDYRDGALLYFGAVNENGGVNGRKIELVTLDDGYVPDKTVANVKKLIADEQVFALVNMFGTGNTLAAMPIVNQAKVPVFSTYSGAAALRTGEMKYLFHSRASYPLEADQLVKQAVQFGAHNLAIAYQDNDFGKAALSAADDAAKKHSANVVARIPVNVDAKNIPDAVASALASKADAVLVLTAGKSGVDFISTFRQKNLGTWLMALSVVSSNELVSVMKEKSRGIVVSQVVPHPWTATATPVVSEYQKLMKRAGKTEADYSYAGLEGFLSAKAFTEALKRSGNALTREKLMSTLESGAMDVGGFALNYGANDHQGSKFVEATMISRGGNFIR